MLEQRTAKQKCRLPWSENTKQLSKCSGRLISVTCGSVQPHFTHTFPTCGLWVNTRSLKQLFDKSRTPQATSPPPRVYSRISTGPAKGSPMLRHFVSPISSVVVDASGPGDLTEGSAEMSLFSLLQRRPWSPFETLSGFELPLQYFARNHLASRNL